MLCNFKLAYEKDKSRGEPYGVWKRNFTLKKTWWFSLNAYEFLWDRKLNPTKHFKSPGPSHMVLAHQKWTIEILIDRKTRTQFWSIEDTVGKNYLSCTKYRSRLTCTSWRPIKIYSSYVGWQVSTRPIVVALSQYILIPNHYVLHLKLICCMSVIPQLKK